MNEQRKQELMAELGSDMLSYLERCDLKQNFIDTTCRTDEEIEFIEGVAYWVEVEE